MFADRYWSKILVLVLAIVTFHPNQGYAAAGSLDLAFGIGGKVTTDFWAALTMQML